MCGNKKDQAKIVWDEIDQMIRGNENLRDKFNVAYGTITHLKSDSFVKSLSKEDGKKVMAIIHNAASLMNIMRMKLMKCMKL